MTESKRYGRPLGKAHGPFRGWTLEELTASRRGHHTLPERAARDVARDFVALREAIAEMAKRCRSSAECLQGEIDRGVAIRQSLESKEGRVAVLKAHADELERLLEAGCHG